MTGHAPVLIIGAGLGGLSAAATLSWRGIRPLLVERHGGTSQHPRARSVNFRSMELLRLMGLEEELVAAGGGCMQDFKIVIAESVTGREIKTIVPRGSFEVVPFSPARSSGAGQDRVEPILRRFAQEHGAEIRVATELVALRETEAGIEAVLRDRRSGKETSLTADYVVAADGNRSKVRNLLGIGLHGHGSLSHSMAIVFRCEGLPLSEHGMVLYYLQNPGFTGAYVSPEIGGKALCLLFRLYRRRLVGIADRDQIRHRCSFRSDSGTEARLRRVCRRRPVGVNVTAVRAHPIGAMNSCAFLVCLRK